MSENETIKRVAYLRVPQPKEGAMQFLPAPEYTVTCTCCKSVHTIRDGSRLELLVYKVLRWLKIYKEYNRE